MHPDISCCRQSFRFLTFVHCCKAFCSSLFHLIPWNWLCKLRIATGDDKLPIVYEGILKIGDSGGMYVRNYMVAKCLTHCIKLGQLHQRIGKAKCAHPVGHSSARTWKKCAKSKFSFVILKIVKAAKIVKAINTWFTRCLLCAKYTVCVLSRNWNGRTQIAGYIQYICRSHFGFLPILCSLAKMNVFASRFCVMKNSKINCLKLLNNYLGR